MQLVFHRAELGLLNRLIIVFGGCLEFVDLRDLIRIRLKCVQSVSYYLFVIPLESSYFKIEVWSGQVVFTVLSVVGNLVPCYSNVTTMKKDHVLNALLLKLLTKLYQSRYNPSTINVPQWSMSKQCIKQALNRYMPLSRQDLSQFVLMRMFQLWMHTRTQSIANKQALNPSMPLSRQDLSPYVSTRTIWLWMSQGHKGSY